MNANRGFWVGLVIVIIILLGVWWWISSQSVPMVANTTQATTTTQSGGSINTVNQPSQSVVAIAENISGASTFGSWLQSTGVAAQITGKGPYTIFVPTDGAISQLAPGSFSGLTAAGQKRFVQYHVVSGRAIDATAMSAGTIQALSGDPLNFSYTSTNIPMVDSAIIIAEYKGSNGVVYVVNNGLIPPKKTQ